MHEAPGKTGLMKMLFLLAELPCYPYYRIPKKEKSITVKSITKIAFPAFLVVFAGLCFPQTTPGTKPSSTAPTAAAKPQIKPEPAKSEEEVIPPAAPNALFPAVVAKVNGKSILGRDLEVAVRRELAAIGSPEWKNLREEYRGELIQTKLFALVNTALLYQKAVESGLKASDAEVQAELQKISKKFKSDGEMNAALAQQNLDRAALEKGISQSLTISKYMDENINKKVSVSSDEVSKFYAENPGKFEHPDLVRTSHILIAAGETGDQDVLAKQRAEALVARAEKGEDFAKLAKDNSIDSSASEGGDIGYFSKDGLQPQYWDAAFSLPVGGVKMIKLDQGYIIIKVTDKKKKGVSTLEEIKEDLAKYLKEEKSQVEMTKLVNQLRNQGNVEFLIPYGQPLEP
jgi:peptidyl-prolyl cis-trans isomerase C